MEEETPQPGLPADISMPPHRDNTPTMTGPPLAMMAPSLGAGFGTRYTAGRPADLSDQWEAILVNAVSWEEVVFEQAVEELIRVDRGQPSLDPAYIGMNLGQTYEAASATLQSAMQKIESYEEQLRGLGIATPVPGPRRFRLNRLPPRQNLPGPGGGGPGSGPRG